MQESVLSVHHVGPMGQTQVVGLVVNTFTTSAISLAPLNCFNHMIYAQFPFLDIVMLGRSQISLLINHHGDFLISQSHIPGEMLWVSC